MRKHTKIILTVLSGYTLLSLIVGCITPLQPMPGPGCDGRLYCYTVDYHDEYLPFGLIGKSLTCGGGNGSWAILPPPTAIFPGLPLYLIEQFAICPAIDTLMIPYDLWLKCWKSHLCDKFGVLVKVRDRDGNPIPDLEIGVTIDQRPGYRIVYNGVARPRGYYSTSVRSDASGTAYIPIDLGNCLRARFNSWALTSAGKEIFDGGMDNEGCWVRVGTGAADRFVRWDEMPDDAKTVVFKLSGRYDAAKHAHHLPPGVSFAEGNDPDEFIASLEGSARNDVMRQWHSMSVPKKVADFDAYWDAAVVTMKTMRNGEPEIEELPCDGKEPVRISRVVFNVGEKRMEGWLCEPLRRNPSLERTPTLAFFPRGKTPSSFPHPTNRVVLYLSVFPPDYDYGRSEYAILKRIGKERTACSEAYSIDGIDKSREEYFFYHVLAGATWAAEWIKQREGAQDGIRCIGADQGAALAIMVAALSDNASYVEACQPGFVAITSDGNCWPQFSWHSRWQDGKRINSASPNLPYWELCSFASRVKCPVTIYASQRNVSAVRTQLGLFNPSFVAFAALNDSAKRSLVIDNTLATTEFLTFLIGK